MFRTLKTHTVDIIKAVKKLLAVRQTTGSTTAQDISSDDDIS
jgi:hypothetical protein